MSAQYLLGLPFPEFCLLRALIRGVEVRLSDGAPKSNTALNVNPDALAALERGGHVVQNGGLYVPTEKGARLAAGYKI